MLFLARIQALSALQRVTRALCDLTYTGGHGCEIGNPFHRTWSLLRTRSEGMATPPELDELRRDLRAVRLAFKRSRGELVAMRFELDHADYLLSRGLELVTEALARLPVEAEEVRT